MAGDPWESTGDCETTITTTAYRSDNGWSTTTSTTSSNERHVTLTVRVRSRCACTHTVSFSRNIEDDPEYQTKIKELIRRRIIENMKATWKQDKKEFKPIPKPGPDIQLRGVCFSGRGWA